MRTIFTRLLVVAGLFAMSASATYYDGKLLVTGPGVLANNTLIDFLFLPNVPSPEGALTVGLGSTGSFLTYAGATGTINDIPPIPANNFIEIAGFLPASANWMLLDLPNPAPLAPICTGAELPGQTCVGVAGSPVLLTRTSDGTSAALQLAGIIIDAFPGGDVSYWNGRIEAGWTGLTPKQISDAAAAGGSPVATWRGDFTVVTPEPGSVFLGLTGLAGIVIGSLRRRKA